MAVPFLELNAQKKLVLQDAWGVLFGTETTPPKVQHSILACSSSAHGPVKTIATCLLKQSWVRTSERCLQAYRQTA
ncbi:hypothetical protein VULLAG_LOCUS12388 [Vulpes lagopus]